MKKTIAQLGLVTTLMLIVLTLSAPADLMAQVISLPSGDNYGTSIPKPDTTQTTAIGQAKSLVGSVSNVARIILGTVAVFMIVLSGFRMILAHGSEEVIEKQKNALLFGIIGLALVALSSEVGKIFSLEGGTFLGSPQAIVARTKLFDNQIAIVITFIKYIIGSIAVLMIVRSALRLITLGSEEDKISEAKQNLTWGAVGLVFITLSDTVINKVLFQIDRSKLPGTSGSQPAFGFTRAVSELVGITNFILVLVAPILVLMFLAGGLMYVTSRGEDEQTGKAKKIITAAFIGTVIVYGAFAIVSTLINGQFG